MEKLTIYELILADGDYIRTYRTTDPLEITMYSRFLGLLGHSQDVGYTWQPVPLALFSTQLKPLHLWK